MRDERGQFDELRLVLDLGALRKIRDVLEQKLRRGMREDGTEIAMLPAFLPPPKENLAGRAVAVDAGGTNLRAAWVRLIGRGRAEVSRELSSAPLPGAVGRNSTDAEHFFAVHREVLSDLGLEAGVPLGYCFSYPIYSQPDGDAVLAKWTKEVQVSGVVGRPVGQLLRRHLESHGISPGSIVVLNDTIATLMAGAFGPKVVPERCIGLIVGTGTNMGAFLPVDALPKLGGTSYAQSHVAVNFESGAFSCPGLGPVDEEVDQNSSNPGDHRFEKAISGAYLGRLYSVAAEKLGVETTGRVIEAAEVSKMALQSMDDPANRLARAVLNRSADLVAAALAATERILDGTGDFYVCAEGTLFWKGPGYLERVRATANRLLEEREPPVQVHLFAVENANLIGSAAAVLTHH